MRSYSSFLRCTSIDGGWVFSIICFSRSLAKLCNIRGKSFTPLHLWNWCHVNFKKCFTAYMQITSTFYINHQFDTRKRKLKREKQHKLGFSSVRSAWVSHMSTVPRKESLVHKQDCSFPHFCPLCSFLPFGEWLCWWKQPISSLLCLSLSWETPGVCLEDPSCTQSRTSAGLPSASPHSTPCHNHSNFYAIAHARDVNKNLDETAALQILQGPNNS